MADLNTPPPFQQPYPFWFWNGDLHPDELRRQIGLMQDVGITEFVMHARTGLQTEFLSEGWFAAIGAAIEEADRRGMRAWIYDEYNWPSGNVARTLTQDPAKREHYLQEDGSLRPLNDKWLGLCSVDYLNPACTDEFISLCYQPYFDRFGAHFGHAVPGFFNDEVRFASPRPWSPSLTEPVPEGGAYFQRLGTRVVEAYFGKLRDWCAAHGVALSGHVMGEETLGSQTRYVADAWTVTNCYHHIGIDHLGRAAQGLHPRLAASVANLTGNRAILSETFAGCPWDFTVEDLYRISGWLYANGVTRVLLHGFFYTREGEAAHDWPPDIFFRWVGWPTIAPYIQWAGRVQYFLSQAQPVCRVALYYPLEEFWANFLPDPNYTLGYTDAARIEGEQARRYHLELGRLMNELIRAGIDYDLVPRHLLDRVRDRVLVVPWEARPEFPGTAVRQGTRVAAECVAEVDRLLGDRPRVVGEGAAPEAARGQRADLRSLYP